MRIEFLGTLLVAAIFLFSGCNEKPDSNITEKAVEQGVESAKEAVSDTAKVIESNVESIKENMEDTAENETEPATVQEQGAIITVVPIDDTEPADETVIEEKVETEDETTPENP